MIFIKHVRFLPKRATFNSVNGRNAGKDVDGGGEVKVEGDVDLGASAGRDLGGLVDLLGGGTGLSADDFDNLGGGVGRGESLAKKDLVTFSPGGSNFPPNFLRSRKLLNLRSVILALGWCNSN